MLLSDSYPQYGDSPVCLDRDEAKDHSGVTALGQGYGTTEYHTHGTLLEANVTVITTEKCREILRYNSTRRIVRNILNVGIPYGLNDQFLCAQGRQNEEVSRS